MLEKVWGTRVTVGEQAGAPAGDVLTTPEGDKVSVVGVFWHSYPTPVYNIEVELAHTYFAGGVWVHNGLDCDDIAERLWGTIKWTEQDKKHIMRHMVDNPERRLHAVFNEHPIKVVEEAVERAKAFGIHPTKEGVAIIPMGRIIGWQGGKQGAREQLSKLYIQLRKDNSVRSAYPIGD